MQNNAFPVKLCQDLMKLSSEGILITNGKGEILSVNEAFTVVTGYSEEELIGKNAGLLKSELHPPQFYSDLWTAICQTGEWRGEIWNKKKSGEVYLVELAIRAVKNEEDLVTHYVGAFSDMNLRLHAKVFETATEGIMITDTKGGVLSVNPAFSVVTGYSFHEIVGKTPRILHSGHQNKLFYIKMWESIHDTGSWQGEIWNRRKNGEVYPEWLSINAVHNANNEITHYIGIFSDISERKRAEDRLKFLAHHDILTGLPNRFLFHDKLNEAIADANRDGNKLAVMFIDLDRFKLINDTLGHSMGDQLLQQVAKKLKGSLRKSDTIARLGGDEFTVILRHIKNTDEVEKIVHNIRGQLSQPFILESQELFVSPSIGISMYPDDGADSNTLIKNADMAMYKAKEHRNQHLFYFPYMNQLVTRRMELDTTIRTALEKGQLQVYYQPQTDGQTGNIIGLEALLRWMHPEFGMIRPVEFIPIAEDNGMILSIGEWVLRTVCKQNKAWQLLGFPHFRAFVNLSARQLQQPHFIHIVKNALDEAGLDYQYLGLEITESISIHQINSIIKTLQELKEMGIEMAVDDFGTGHSSLSYLKRYPVGVLKIDKSFIKNIENDTVNAAIVKGIVHMAAGLKVRVVAEGVETEEQSRFLRKIGCHSFQGYLIGHPMPPEKLESYLGKIT